MSDQQSIPDIDLTRFEDSQEASPFLSFDDSVIRFTDSKDSLNFFYIGAQFSESLYGQKGTEPMKDIHEIIQNTCDELPLRSTMDVDDFVLTNLHGIDYVLISEHQQQRKIDDVARNIERSINERINQLDMGLPGLQVHGILYQHDGVLPENIRIYNGIKSLMGYVLNQPESEKEYLRSMIKDIIENQQLESVYQPIYELGSDEIHGYEALSRCQKDELNNPFKLFQSAMTANMIDELEYECRRQALKNFNGGGADKRLFINLYPETFKDDRIFDPDQNDPLNKIDPSQCILEITERSAIDNLDSFKQHISLLQKRGFNIAIDDVGTGYAALDLIGELNPDYLKLDMSLIRDIHTHEHKQKLLDTLLKMAKDIEATTVAEGVEKKEELDYLNSTSCALAQGFYLARPSGQLKH